MPAPWAPKATTLPDDATGDSPEATAPLGGHFMAGTMRKLPDRGGDGISRRGGSVYFRRVTTGTSPIAFMVATTGRRSPTREAPIVVDNLVLPKEIPQMVLISFHFGPQPRVRHGERQLHKFLTTTPFRR